MDSSTNHFFSILPDDGAAILMPHLERVVLKHETLLYERDDVIDHIYFPTGCLVSLVVPLIDGGGVEAAMVGRDGVVGALSSINGQRSTCRAMVQIEGDAMTLEPEFLRELVHKNTQMRSVIGAHEEVMLAQSLQSVACHASHSLHERLAKWLLLARDRLGRDTLELTQEFVAEMLGVRRSSVTMEAHEMQQAGFISYRRGHITILDAENLKDAACECYQVISSRFARLYAPQENW
jgi:CRP-like cAMP-binding protein